MVSTTWLRKAELFGTLEESQLDALLEHSTVESLRERTVIFHQGDDATHLFVLIEGAVDLSVKGSDQTDFMTSCIQKEGAVFGIPSLFEPFRYNVTAIASIPTKLLRINAAELRRKMDDDPKMGLEIMKKLAAIYFTRLNDLRMGVSKFFRDFPSKAG
jgi:CRP/FNR family transcriptional regulator, cyclic AMP receptor protein